MSCLSGGYKFAMVLRCIGVVPFGDTELVFVTLIKCPTRDAWLYMGEATPPDPYFLFTIAWQP